MEHWFLIWSGKGVDSVERGFEFWWSIWNEGEKGVIMRGWEILRWVCLMRRKRCEGEHGIRVF